MPQQVHSYLDESSSYMTIIFFPSETKHVTTDFQRSMSPLQPVNIQKRDIGVVHTIPDLPKLTGPWAWMPSTERDRVSSLSSGWPGPLMSAVKCNVRLYQPLSLAQVREAAAVQQQSTEWLCVSYQIPSVPNSLISSLKTKHKCKLLCFQILILLQNATSVIGTAANVLLVCFIDVTHCTQFSFSRGQVASQGSHLHCSVFWNIKSSSLPLKCLRLTDTCTFTSFPEHGCLVSKPFCSLRSYLSHP